MKGVKKTDLLTFFGDPNQKVESEYGIIPLLQWCQQECKRINQINQNAVVMFNEVGSVAIVNRRKLC